MKNLLKLSTLIIVLTFVSCSSNTPTLCDCLTNPKYANYGDSNYKKCEQVFKNQYGTIEPSNDQMRSDYYNCKSK